MHNVVLVGTMDGMFASDCLPTERFFQVAAHLLLIIGLGLACSAGVPVAFAQNPSVAPADEQVASAYWRDHFDEQIAHELLKRPSMRDTYIQIVVSVASDREHLDLSQTAGALLDIVESDSNREHRLMAIQALHTIGIDHTGEKRYRRAMDRLYTLMQGESSEQVRRAAAQTLTQYNEKRTESG